jgi:hypothetical protein
LRERKRRNFPSKQLPLPAVPPHPSSQRLCVKSSGRRSSFPRAASVSSARAFVLVGSGAGHGEALARPRMGSSSGSPSSWRQGRRAGAGPAAEARRSTAARGT